MKLSLAIFLLQGSATNAAIYETLFPSAKPTTSDNDIDCMFEDFYPIFSALTPNGSLSTALLSYGDELLKDCPLTDVDVMGLPTCPYPALSEWCSFSNHAPKTLLPAWSSYGSSASSWWSEHSSYAVKYAHVCKKKWFNAMIGVVYGSARLNNTIHWGECYAQAHATVDRVAATPASTTKATTGMKVTPTAPKETQVSSDVTEGNSEETQGTAKEDRREESKGTQIQARGADVWLMAGGGLAAAVVNDAM
ncbi:uncharacterized protein FIESC28_00966 [Fusarium coffeatum]|uniref:DUF7735 domain-containing protein n=1 Tax=Fusarium coffeatum TaxID=231269 RepID=A0A366SA26_9HYPO|nr:uncharacterized protein FIESC28_00966 [Fusarium coffeatum]RBR26183.1 hypothetical protein FIESC28_00966 [Fusarium coffeatum]